MFKVSKCLLVLALAGAISMMTATAFGAPTVSYSVSGSSNNWILDFSVTNTLGDSNQIYFFGVQLPTRNIAGTPTGWDPNYFTSWDNSSYGGSNTQYNNNWITFHTPYDIFNDRVLSGFDVLVTEDIPTSIPWFAYAYGGAYTGTDYFNMSGNPGFEGTVASSTTVPEPTTMLLLGLGLIGLAGIRRMFKQ